MTYGTLTNYAAGDIIPESWADQIGANFVASFVGQAGTAGQMVYATGSNAVTPLAPGTAYQVLTYGTAAAPVWNNAGQMWKIAETELGASATTIDFSTIDQTYTHLLLLGSVRTDQAAEVDNVILRVNNNSTADDYTAQLVQGLAATASASEFVTDETSARVALATGATATARYFGNFKLWIYDYSDTNKAPAWTSEIVTPTGVATGDLYSRLMSGMLDVAGAVTRLTFLPGAGTNFVEHSLISLYGIR